MTNPSTIDLRQVRTSPRLGRMSIYKPYKGSAAPMVSAADMIAAAAYLSWARFGAVKSFCCSRLKSLRKPCAVTPGLIANTKLLRAILDRMLVAAKAVQSEIDSLVRDEAPVDLESMLADDFEGEEAIPIPPDGSLSWALQC